MPQPEAAIADHEGPEDPQRSAVERERRRAAAGRTRRSREQRLGGGAAPGPVEALLRRCWAPCTRESRRGMYPRHVRLDGDARQDDCPMNARARGRFRFDPISRRGVDDVRAERACDDTHGYTTVSSLPLSFNHRFYSHQVIVVVVVVVLSHPSRSRINADQRGDYVRLAESLLNGTITILESQ